MHSIKYSDFKAIIDLLNSILHNLAEVDRSQNGHRIIFFSHCDIKGIIYFFLEMSNLTVTIDGKILERVVYFRTILDYKLMFHNNAFDMYKKAIMKYTAFEVIEHWHYCKNFYSHITYLYQHIN